MATQVLSAADLGLTVARKGTTPTTLGGLITELRNAVAEWDALANDPKRENGGQVAAKARVASRLVHALVTDHGADTEALRVMIAERGILKADNDAVIAAIGLASDADAKPPTTAKAAKAA